MCSHTSASFKWSAQEHKLFLQGLETHGRGSWKKIHKNFVKTRTCSQVASHAQKHFLRLARKDAKTFIPKLPRTPRARPPTPCSPTPCSPTPCSPTPCPAVPCPAVPCPAVPCPAIRRPIAKLPALPCPMGSTNERQVYYAPLVCLLNNQLIAHEQKGAVLRAQLLCAEFLATC